MRTKRCPGKHSAVYPGKHSAIYPGKHSAVYQGPSLIHHININAGPVIAAASLLTPATVVRQAGYQALHTELWLTTAHEHLLVRTCTYICMTTLTLIFHTCHTSLRPPLNAA
jgi:hypothetical protein